MERTNNKRNVTTLSVRPLPGVVQAASHLFHLLHECHLQAAQHQEAAPHLPVALTAQVPSAVALDVPISNS